VSALVRSQLDDLDEAKDKPGDDEAATDILEHVSLGSNQKGCTLRSVEQDHAGDRRFHNFRTRLSRFFNIFFPAHNIPLPSNKPITFEPDNLVHILSAMPTQSLRTYQVIEHRFIIVRYESMVDWKLKSDYLRCSPMFHNSPRYDGVIIQSLDTFFFGKLIFIFSCTVNSVSYPIALIHPLDVPIGVRRQLDQDLGIIRLKAVPEASTEFISVHSIIRGALIVEDFDNPREVLVIDMVDADMFLRLKGLKL
jgi:hypothetical protein